MSRTATSVVAVGWAWSGSDETKKLNVGGSAVRHAGKDLVAARLVFGNVGNGTAAVSGEPPGAKRAGWRAFRRHADAMEIRRKVRLVEAFV